MIVIVMGVSGVGKTTIGRALAQRIECAFLDGDDFHPAANVRKMAGGQPLGDEDRWPWLARLNAELRAREAAGESAVLACSALKLAYRERLAHGLAGPRFVFLDATIEVIHARLAARQHRYMPASLLESQFAALERPADALRIDVSGSPEACVEAAAAALGPIRA